MLVLKTKMRFIFILFMLPGILFCQSRTGRILSSETGSGVAYVNIGLIGKNLGTVSDQNGNFKIDLTKANDNDSVRFSMIGYGSKTLTVSKLRGDSLKNIYLTPVNYNIEEIKVTYHKPKNLRIGNPVETNDLRSGFSNNDLGSELGIKAFVKKKVVLKNVNLDVAVCTYDSVIYRLNIYQTDNQIDYRNILKEPIYIFILKRGYK